jgi:hypothetical protein
MLSDPIRDQAGARTPLLEQQQGMPMAAQNNGRDALAAIMEKLNGMGGRGFRPGGSRDRSGGVQDRSPSGDRAAGKGLY